MILSSYPSSTRRKSAPLVVLVNLEERLTSRLCASMKGGCVLVPSTLRTEVILGLAVVRAHQQSFVAG